MKHFSVGNIFKIFKIVNVIMQSLMLLCSVSIVEYNFCVMIGIFKMSEATSTVQIHRDMRVEIKF